MNDTSHPTDELRDDAARIAGAATDRLHVQADSGKGAVTDQARKASAALGTAARELGSNGPNWLKSGLEQGARAIEQLAQTVDRKDSRELVDELQSFARQRPSSFLAGCAFAGFAAARIFKAGAAGSASFAGSKQPQAFDPYASEARQDDARPVMPFTDGGGTAAPVSPQALGTSL